MKHSKHMTLTDVFCVNGSAVKAQHWCCRWLHFAQLPLPKIHNFNLSTAIKFDENAGKEQCILRSVRDEQFDYQLDNRQPKNLVLHGTATLWKRDRQQAVNLISCNDGNGRLVVVAICKHFVDFFSEYNNAPDIVQNITLRDVRLYRKQRLVQVNNFVPTSANLIEITASTIAYVSDNERAVVVFRKSLFFDDVQISTFEMRQPKRAKKLRALKETVEHLQTEYRALLNKRQEFLSALLDSNQNNPF